MSDFWKMPLLDTDLPDPGADEEATKGRTPVPPPMSPSSVVWPPIASQLGVAPPPPGPPPPDPSAGGSEGRGWGRWKGSGKAGRSDKVDGPVGGRNYDGGDAGAYGGAGQKREDGWLPKAEYEAKKREERARRQKEREVDQGTTATATANSGFGKNQKGGGGSNTVSGRGRGNGRDWQYTIPKRPEPPAETAEIRAAREAEEVRLSARDKLRSATTAEELRAAIAAARELGLAPEVQMGEKKLAKMEG